MYAIRSYYDVPPYFGDKDSDQDGILDSIDECPNNKETYNKFKDHDGCPDFVSDTSEVADSDGDGRNNFV